MRNFLFFGALRALGNARTIRRFATVLLRAMSVITLLLGLYLLYLMATNIFHEGAPTEVTLYGIVTIILFLTGLVAVTQILWFRSNSVSELPEGPFPAIPVFALIIRAIGEIYASIVAAFAFSGAAAIWIARGQGTTPNISLPGIGMPGTLFENSFFQGLLVLFWMLVLAALVLLLFYFIAEASIVTVDIAVNIRTFLRLPAAPPAPAPPAPPSLPQHEPPPQPQYAGPQPPIPAPRCPNCGNEVAPGATFCNRCGSPLGR